jgi:Secretion system C-terminal sorting domain
LLVFRATVLIAGRRFFGGGNDFINCVQSDALGNIYVLGQVTPRSDVPGDIPVHFDTDLILPVSPNADNENKQSLFIIKYNGDGVFQWLRMPQSGAISLSETLTYTNAQDLQVDAQGNSYSLCHLPVGVYGNGAYAVTVSGFNILKYDTNGVFLGGVPIDIQFGNPRVPARMRRNHQTGDYYVAGQAYQTAFESDRVTINGQIQTKVIFIAAFSSTGSFLWKRENNNFNVFGQNVPGIAIDSENNVFMVGTGGPIVNGSTLTPDSFNGTALTTLTTSPIPFIVKMDANGNNLWLTSGTKTRPMDLILHGDEVVTCGAITNMTWQNLSFVSPTLSQHAYIARFNKNTGTILSINPTGTTSSDLGVALATDSKGNYYLGGKFGGTMTVGASTLVKSGGDTDFFIAKFGSTDCNFLATNEFEKNSLQGFPNPVQNSLQLNNTEASSYVLYDMLGARVQTGVVATKGEINLSTIAAGMYVLQLQTQTGSTQMMKLVKE